MKKWKYVQVKTLKEIQKNEIVNVCYKESYKNFTGYKTDEKIKEALKDSRQGLCKLLVWREVNDEMDIAPDFSVFKDKDLIDELRKRGYTISVTDQNSIPVSTNSMFEYPCKIGDPVYIIDHDENNKLKIYKGKWKRVSLIQDKKDQAFELRGEVVYDIYDTFYNDGRTMKHGMYVGQIGTRIGERIFLKEKDAEEALALLNS